jgi:UPF0042 nucleotide-binding protein
MTRPPAATTLTPPPPGEGEGRAQPGAAPRAPHEDLGPEIVLVTGPSGAGRTTAIRALEDLGFEVIDNLPLSLLPRLLDGPPLGRPLALGIDPRNRDFGAEPLVAVADRLAQRTRSALLYLDCREEVLLRRFSETRRRHPLAPDGAPATGIARERVLLAPVRDRADVVIDTSALTPHELRAAIERRFAPPGGRPLAITVESFSYRRGLPAELDIALDCRFLRNPHWDAALRPHDGRDPAVAAFVEADPRYAPFLAHLESLVLALLPAYREEGKSHLAIGLGCTGGQHRSVTVAERLAETLAKAGWRVSIRHRELERRAGADGAADRG